VSERVALSAARASALTPLVLYGVALRQGSRLRLLDTRGTPIRSVDTSRWAALRPGDTGLLARCGGATLDVGCGPGRLTAALAEAGHPALGVDISAEAVRQARHRGAAALRRCVFGPLPGEGRWRRVLLADGNIGIGGDPVRLLRRCARLLGRDGAALVELDPPGTTTWRGEVALTDGERVSATFPWAFVGVDGFARLAGRGGLRVLESWTEAGRWFARVSHC
jgi:SAM-dependent methyltransferase